MYDVFLICIQDGDCNQMLKKIINSAIERQCQNKVNGMNSAGVIKNVPIPVMLQVLADAIIETKDVSNPVNNIYRTFIY